MSIRNMIAVRVKPRRSISFRVKLLATLLGLVLVLTAGVLIVIQTVLGRTLRTTLENSAKGAVLALEQRFLADLDRLSRTAMVVAGEPRLRAVLASTEVDRATLEDVLDELAGVTHWDLVALLAPDGEVRAMRGPPEHPTRIDAASVATPPKATTAPEGSRHGYLRLGPGLYRVALVPIRFGSQFAGTIVAGERITEGVLADTAQAGGAVIAVLSGDMLVAASRPLESAEQTEAVQLAGATGEVRFGAERYVARSVTLAPDVTAVVLRSADETFGPYERTRRLVWLVGIGAFVTVAILAWVLSAGLAKPVTTLEQLADASVERAERTQLDMQRLMDVIPDGIAVESGGALVYANRAMARLLGRASSGNVVGAPLEGNVHPDDRAVYDTLTDSNDGPSEVRLLGADGTPLATEMRAIPVDFAGQPAIVTLTHDLALRKAYEARLLADRSAAKELEVARAIQQSMVPTEATVDRVGLKLAGHFEPAAQCGGDWWNYYDLPGDRLLLLIGDVTGHGIPSAMITAAAKAACDTVTIMTKGDVSCELLLEIMNGAVFLASRGRFIMTCFAAIFDGHTRTVTFANAGHNFPLVVRGSDGELSSLVTRGNPLGDGGTARHETKTATLDPGDVLVLFTDGLIDGRAASGEAYGARRLREIVRASASLPPAAMRDTIVGSYRAFVKTEAPTDDVTLVIARVASPSPVLETSPPEDLAN